MHKIISLKIKNRRFNIILITFLLISISSGLVAIFGYQYWKYEKKNNGEKASILFDRLHTSLSESNPNLSIMDELQNRYSSFPYAILGAFLMAKYFVVQQNLDLAQRYMQWAFNHTQEESLKHIARIRLGEILLSRNKANKVIDLLSINNMSTFSARYYEILGDAYYHINDHVMAKNLYQNSLKSLLLSEKNSTLVQLKIDNIIN